MSNSLFITSVNAHYQNANARQNQLQVSHAFIRKMTTALSDEWPNSDGRYVSCFPYITFFFNTIKQLTLKSQMSENRNIKMLKYIYKQIY